jgi:propionyl-CoA carboxylase alpha chain
VIKRILIANRGEIARRIARTAVNMGIETAAVYAEGDRDWPFVREAAIAIPLKGTGPGDTYLNIERLLEAAALADADAVHPGYGFLSERAAFARAVIGAGLVWIGPPPEVIEVMGDKLAAKRLMGEAGVPILPSIEVGTDSMEDIDLSTLEFPVMVKAAAGGGGKGMRIVGQPVELEQAVLAARREAASAFGDATVFLERYLEDARHIEIQIVADELGSVIHCFERECSVQRRHQKVIEEAPSPIVDDALRSTMTEAAVTAARAVGYRSTGTVEFVVEPSGAFWFLEVNTRLQVEHPVTEAITGLDLVREQIRIADGEPISVIQADLSISGHAVEARLYAESPSTGFLPAAGTIAEWRPAPEPAVRWDSGVESATVVGVEFDPMLAKVVAHAPTRVEAVAKLALALERAHLRGLETNRDFLVASLRHPVFVRGEATTSFIESSGVQLKLEPTINILRVSAVAAALAIQRENRDRARVLRSLPSGWRNSVMPPQSVEFDVGDETLAVSYEAKKDGSFSASVGPWSEEILFSSSCDGSISVELGCRRHRLELLKDGERIWVQGEDGDLLLRQRPRFPDPESDVPPGALVAPMPGCVTMVEVKVGQVVARGDLLLVVEAMKMEHRITAPHEGIVADIRVGAGDQVGAGDLLVVVEEPS